jgi:hypothetical protein
MKNNFKYVLIILFWLFNLTATTFAQSLSSQELIKNAKDYDGKLITYSGEVVGDLMRRGGFAWVNIHDGENALGVWVNFALCKEINFTGKYETHGDSLEVVGVFHQACVEHGGDLDIHAQSMRKLGNGRMAKDKLNSDKVNASLILLGIILVVWILTLFKHK